MEDLLADEMKTLANLKQQYQREVDLTNELRKQLWNEQVKSEK